MNSFQIHTVDWTPQKVSRFWSYLTSTPSAEQSYFSGFFGERILELTARYIPKNAKRILDYGCGPGFLMEHMLQRGFHAEGLEFSAVSAQNARVRCESYPSFGGIIHIPELPSPLPTGGIDAVFLIEVIEHLLPQQQDATLKEIQRMTRPGGVLVLSTPHREDLGRVSTICPDCGCVFHPWQHVDAFDANRLSDLLFKYGFECMTCMPTNLGAKWYSRLLRQFNRLCFGSRATEREPHLVYVGRRTARPCQMSTA